MSRAVPLLRRCFGLSSEDAGHVVDLLGEGAFRFDPVDAAEPDAMLATWRIAQWWGGQPVPAAAVAFVGVDPPARGRGAGSRLLARTLGQLRAEGAALALLYPATLSLYEKAGFARAGFTRRMSAPPASFGRVGAGFQAASFHGAGLAASTMLRMTALDADLLAAIRRAAVADGMLERDEALWTLALHPDGESEIDVYLALGADGPEGYMALTPPRAGRLRVADHCLLTPEAAAAAAGLLASHRGRVDRIVWNAAPDDLLLHGLIDVGSVVDDWEEWMLRILDIPAALSARGYSSHAQGELLLKIDDSTLPQNNGQWQLTVRDGKGFVVRTDDSCAENIRLSLNTLSALYSGYINPSAARRMRRIVADDPQAAALASVFSGGYPYFCDRF